MTEKAEKKTRLSDARAPPPYPPARRKQGEKEHADHYRVGEDVHPVERQPSEIVRRPIRRKIQPREPHGNVQRIATSREILKEGLDRLEKGIDMLLMEQGK